MFDKRQLATVLAALRYWQREGLMNGGHEQDIATDGGTVTPLSKEEIDSQCETINRDDLFRYLDLSTGHLSAETRDWLTEATPSYSPCSSITIAQYEYGWFISIPANDESIDDLEVPDDLKSVLRYARNIGCDVVRLDADGIGADGLPVFED